MVPNQDLIVSHVVPLDQDVACNVLAPKGKEKGAQRRMEREGEFVRAAAAALALAAAFMAFAAALMATHVVRAEDGGGCGGRRHQWRVRRLLPQSLASLASS
jgi:hypothetical protein